MAPGEKAGRVVFIGNIPYGGTEELIIETLGRVGEVLNFRLVYDKETGRPKGFGFAEFKDADAAASAVRNLNDYEIMGRKLRVDWSNDNGAGDNAPPASNPAPALNGTHTIAPQEATAPPQSTALPPLPPGTDLPPNLTCPDAISRTLGSLPTPQLLEILSQMKGLVMTDPGKATELLRRAPQLAYAIFQSLLLLNLVDPSVLGQLIDPTSAPAAPPQPPPQPPVVQPTQPPQAYGGYVPQPTPTPVQYTQQPQYVQPPAQPAPTPGLDAQQQAYAQILAMTPQQIDMLPPEQRGQIMQIRQLLLAGQRP